MDITREEALQNMKDYEVDMLDRFVWKEKYAEVPEDVKDFIKNRFLYANINYRFAKQKNEYVRKLQDAGLKPQFMRPGSGYVYLSDALLADVAVSAWLTIDDDTKSNGILGLRSTISNYVKTYPILKIDKIEGKILNSPNIKWLRIIRNNIVAHSNIDIFQHLDNISNNNAVVMMEKCFDEMFEVLQIINDTYFDTSIPKEHNLNIDEDFIEDVTKIFKKSATEEMRQLYPMIFLP